MERPAKWRTLVTLAVATGLSVACGGNPKASVPASAPRLEAAPAPAPTPPPVPDPVTALLSLAESHFAAGERELKVGHLGRARVEFDRAVDLLLESPYGVRTNPRISAQYERLLDRISGYDTTAMAAGDGFAEKPSEPAPIDELLATSAFVPRSAAPALDAIKETVSADLAATTHDVPIPLNERVLAYVELFQGRLREWVENGLRRGTQYLPMIQQVFRAEGLPLDLAYVPLIESAFKPNAVSRAQAKGVWQFMRGTALENGLKHDWYIDERADPEKATKAAAKYLTTLHGMFGDWHLALASYNGGPGLVQRAMKRTGAEDFWELSQSPRALPRETREYVPMILAAMIIARNPVQYRLQRGARAAGGLRHGRLGSGRRPAPGGRVDQRVGGRDSGAQPGAATLDNSRPQPAVQSQGPPRKRRKPAGEARRGAAYRVCGPQVAHGEAWRDRHGPRAALQGEPVGSGRRQWSLTEVPPATRRATADSPRARPALGHPLGDGRGASIGTTRARRGGHRNLPGEARRHAVCHRPPVPGRRR